MKGKKTSPPKSYITETITMTHESLKQINNHYIHSRVKTQLVCEDVMTNFLCSESHTHISLHFTMSTTHYKPQD
jgi:hypothetical protein